MITIALRDLLIEHIDGPVPVSRRKTSAADNGRARVIRAAIARGLLACEPPNNPRPTLTVITERGRHELARALADWAEAFVRARRGAEDLLGRLKLEAALQDMPRKVREKAFSGG